MSIFGGIRGSSGSSELNAAKQKSTIDKTIASGQRARARADKATAKANRANVRTDIERKNGYRHGVTIGLYSKDSMTQKTPTRSNGKKK